MAKQSKLTELVTAKKDGYAKREFTRHQLEAMGTDPGGKTYDGWAIVESTKEPKEVSDKKSSTEAAENKAVAIKEENRKTHAIGEKGELGPAGSNEQ